MGRFGPTTVERSGQGPRRSVLTLRFTRSASEGLFARKDREAAKELLSRNACEQAGVKTIIYLGGQAGPGSLTGSNGHFRRPNTRTQASSWHLRLCASPTNAFGRSVIVGKGKRAF